MIEMVKNSISWWIKIVCKIILTKIPVKYSFWKKMGLFEHGDMDNPERSLETFLEHAKNAGILRSNQTGNYLIKRKNENYSVLEIGPGDSIFTAVIAFTLGATKSWLVDAGDYASRDMTRFNKLIDCLDKRGMKLDIVNNWSTTNELLYNCNCTYLTSGLTSMKEIPLESIDYCFSNAVMEHIPKEQFEAYAGELYRVLKKDSVAIHRIDLKDHLGGRLEHLRFPEKVWESNLFKKSGFYTNRLRMNEIISIFEQKQFYCKVIKTIKWEILPTHLRFMDNQFRQMDREVLKISGFDIILKKQS